MSVKVGKLMVELLTDNPEHKFTASEIATWIYENHTESCKSMISNSTNKNLKSVKNNEELIKLTKDILRAYIYAQYKSTIKNNPSIKVLHDSPKKFFYTEKDEEANKVSDDIELNDNSRIKEHDLYPKLSEFLKDELSIFPKRIDERKSKNNRGTRGNMWLYPDLVALEALTLKWEEPIKKCVKLQSAKSSKIWSFEVKLRVDNSNIREVFFQTVSNSSWANLGYLVACELVGDKVKDELQILCELHGIGYIRLNYESPSESEIVIPAREKPDVDWNTANRILDQNDDFKDFIDHVTRFHQTDFIDASNW